MSTSINPWEPSHPQRILEAEITHLMKMSTSPVIIADFRARHPEIEATDSELIEAYDVAGGGASDADIISILVAWTEMEMD